MKIRLFVLTECTNVTDTQTDTHTPHDGIGRACIASCSKNGRAYGYARYSLSIIREKFIGWQHSGALTSPAVEHWNT